jgi:nicotine blue oxidoreductase
MNEQRPSPIAGLILAGGEGKRFGGPKAFAMLDEGRTFLEACAATLIGAGASPVVATLPPGAENPEIDDLLTVELPASGLDMFASIMAGLERVTEFPDWGKIALLPVEAAIPSYRGKHGHPVCVARTVVERIVDGELTGPTLRDVLRSVDAVDVPVDDVGVISNCNTPAALSAALRANEE